VFYYGLFNVLSDDVNTRGGRIDEHNCALGWLPPSLPHYLDIVTSRSLDDLKDSFK